MSLVPVSRIAVILALGSACTASDSGSDASGDTDVVESAGCEGVCTPKSLVIALDGMRPDALVAGDTPNFKSLIEGSWAPGYKGSWAPDALVVPDGDSYSGPNHAAIEAGATVSQLNVSSNDSFIIANGNWQEYPPYLARLEQDDATRNTAFAVSWSGDLLMHPGSDYVARALESETTRRIVSMLTGDGENIVGEQNTVWVGGTDPDAIFLFFDFTDGLGHSFGFDLNVPEYVGGAELSDDYLGQILDAIRGRSAFADENWQIMVTADHGGYHTGHSGRTAPMQTIPFILSSRDVKPGILPDGVYSLDVTPTVMDHFGLAPDDRLTGHIRGGEVQPEPPSDITDGLVAYYPFDGDTKDASGNGRDATIGGGSPAVAASGGVLGGKVTFAGNDPCYLSLPTSDELDFLDGEDFTIAFWMRANGDPDGDPVIVGNKDWSNGGNPGFATTARKGSDTSIESNYASGSSGRLDVEAIDYPAGAWRLVVQVFKDNGSARTYVGHPDGKLEWMSLEDSRVGSLHTDMPINVGQDGTGSYPFQFNGDVDELAIWDRALGHEEIYKLLADGAGLALKP